MPLKLKLRCSILGINIFAYLVSINVLFALGSLHTLRADSVLNVLHSMAPELLEMCPQKLQILILASPEFWEVGMILFYLH